MKGCTVTLTRHVDGRTFAEVRLYGDDEGESPELAVVDVSKDFRRIVDSERDPRGYQPTTSATDC